MIKLANKDDGIDAFRVSDESNILKNLILKHWEDNKTDFFPAPQPVSLDRKSIYKLVQNEYLVCVKSDGMRFLMINYDHHTYMTDRAFKFSKVDQFFKDDLLYKNGNKCGFIIDGELVKFKNSNKWQYIVHDCINMCGVSVFNQTFPKRYEQVKFLINEVWLSEKSNFKISEKQFYPFEELNELYKNIENMDHYTDGIIFTPKYKKIGTNTQYDLFKWKPRNLHTFDFKIIVSEDGVTAYVNKNGIHVPYANAAKNTKEEKMFNELLAKNCRDFVNGSIVECSYDDINILYEPVKLRSDKIHPNSLYTIEKTLLNIKENITINELIQLSSDK